jgi:hypothetical protein
MRQKAIFKECGFDWGSFDGADSSMQQKWVADLLHQLKEDGVVERIGEPWRLTPFGFCGESVDEDEDEPRFPPPPPPPLPPSPPQKIGGTITPGVGKGEQTSDLAKEMKEIRVQMEALRKEMTGKLDEMRNVMEDIRAALDV